MKDITVGDIYKYRNRVAVTVTRLTDKCVTFVDSFGFKAEWPRDHFAAEFLDEPYENLVIRDLRRECAGLKEPVETLERERDEARCEAASMRVPFGIAQRERDDAREESEFLRGLDERQKRVTRELWDERNDLKKRVKTLERERDEARLEAAAAAAEANERAADMAACLQDRFDADQGLRDAVALECLKTRLPHHFVTGKRLTDAARSAYQAADAFLKARDRVQIPATDSTKVS